MRSLDEILGPVMIGPSSSHTAGACRIGKIAHIIVNDKFNDVKFYLHGSFGKTYKGHGTDRALVGGMLGMDTDDERITNSLEIAKSMGINISFIEEDLGSEYHPNTVKIQVQTLNGDKHTIVGSSIGGGNIEIIEINGKTVYFTGKYDTLIINHVDKPGLVHSVSGVLSQNNINIAYLKVFRDIKGNNASMVFELDGYVDLNTIDEIKKIEYVKGCTFIKAIS